MQLGLTLVGKGCKNINLADILQFAHKHISFGLATLIDEFEHEHYPTHPYSTIPYQHKLFGKYNVQIK